MVRAFEVDPDDVEFPNVLKPVGFSGEKYKGDKSFDGVPTASYKKA